MSGGFEENPFADNPFQVIIVTISKRYYEIKTVIT